MECDPQNSFQPTTNWTSSSGSLPLSSTSNSTHLALRRVTAGITPICTVTNIAGNDSASSTINVNGKKLLSTDSLYNKINICNQTDKDFCDNSDY